MPTKYRRVTVTLPARLVEALDHKLTEPDETRSAVIRPEKLAELDLALHFTLGITTCPSDL
jgi:hypothetical protein